MSTDRFRGECPLCGQTDMRNIREALVKACDMIMSEYCSHKGECSADEPTCYISEFLAVLRGYYELETTRR